MSDESIIESGMTFGPYGEGECFRLETSAAYKALGEGVKIAEFLLLRSFAGKCQAWVVEAKSSSPQSKDQTRFSEFIRELGDKLVHGFNLGIASCLGRHSAADQELSAMFRELDLKTMEFRLVVVFNGHSDEWLPELQSALGLQLHSTVKTWGLGARAVVVLNDRLARKHGLIS